MDGSGSVLLPHFKKGLEFVVETLSSLNLEVDKFALIVFSDEAETVVPLTRLASSPEESTQIVEETITLVKNADYPAESTNTADAIKVGAELLEQQDTGRRIMYVVTDGCSDVPRDTREVAKVAREEKKISIFTFAIGPSVKEKELEDIRGCPEGGFHSTTMSELSKLERRLNEAVTNLPSVLDTNQPVWGLVAPDQKRNYEVPISSKGVVVQVDQIQGATIAYYAYQCRNPSKVINDGFFFFPPWKY